MGNFKQLLLFFLLMMVKWDFVVSGYEVPVGIISTAVLPSNDENETEEQTESANVVLNEIPVQERQERIAHKESLPANHLLNLIGTGGSPKEVYNAIATFLSQQNLTPGQTTQVEIIPPEGSKTDFLNTFMRDLKLIVPKLVTNAPVSFKLGATKNADNTLRKFQLGIIVGPAIQETNDRFRNYETPKSNVLAPISLDLTSSGDPDVELTRVLVQGLDEAKPYIKLGKPSEMVLHITPHQDFNTKDEQNILESITRILNELVPTNVQTIVHGRCINNTDGTVQTIDVHILLQPTEQSGGENIEVDLSSPGRDIPKTLEETLVMLIRTDNPKSYNLQITPPTGATPETAKNIANIVNSILIRLIPNRRPEINYQISTGPDGYVNKINVKVDMEPSNKTNNPNVLQFDADLSNPTTSLREEILRIIPTIKNVIAKQKNKGPITVALDIKPPKGVTNVTNVLEITQETLLEFLPTSNIGVQAKITKDSRGNIVNISVISTIEPLNKNTGNELNIDLSKIGTHLTDYLINLTPQFKKILDKEHPQNSPTSLTLNIQPPKGANDQFVRNSMNTVTTFLSKLLPDKEISVQAKATKDINGEIINTSLYITAEQGRPTEQPKNTVITVDLSDPNVNLDDVVLEILPHLQKKVNDNDNKPRTFSLNIIQPKGSGIQFVQNTLNYIIQKLAKYLPNDKLKVQSTITKDNGDNIVNIGLNIIAKPSPTNEEPNKKNISIDLSQPESDIDEEISQIIPRVKFIIKDHPSDVPVEFNLNIEPPKGATEEFVKIVTDKVRNDLVKILPEKYIDIQPKIVRDIQGNIINIDLTINIKPSQETEVNKTTENPFIESVVTTETTINDERKITVNLNKPGVTLVQELTEKLHTLKRDVENRKINGKPVTFEIDIQPPKGAKDDFVKNTSNNVITTLSHIFPNNKIGVKVKTTKDDRGNIIHISYDVDIQPEPSSKEKEDQINKEITTPYSETTESTRIIEVTEKPRTITINLDKPGVDLVEEITRKLPTLKDDVEKSKTNGKPVTFEMNIQPPKGAKDDFVKDTSNNVITTLSHILPNNKIALKVKTTKDDQNNIIDISYVVDIQPESSSKETEARTTTPSSKGTSEDINSSTTEFDKIEVTEVTTEKPRTITVNLDKPGVDLSQEITEKLPTIKKDVENSKTSGKPVTFEMNIQPPKGVNDDFVKDTSNNVITTLSHLLPNNKIALKVKTTKDDQNNIIDISYVVDIQPESSSKVIEDRFNPRATTETNAVIESASTTPSGETIIVTNIPSATETEKSSVSTISSEIISKERNSYSTTVSSNVEPEATTTNTNREKNVDINLSEPNSSLPKKVEEVLPKIITSIKKDLNQGKPVTLNFDIEPPPKSTVDFLQTAPKSLFPILSKYFPNNRIDLKTTAKKNSQGYITDVVLSVNIEPSNEAETTTPAQFQEKNVEIVVTEQTTQNQEPQTTTPTINREKAVDIDLSEPDSSLPKKVDELLPKIITPLKKDLNQGKPVTLNFDIEPPPKSTSDFLQTAPKSLFPILTKYFPNNKIDLKTTAKKNSQGYITDVVLSVNIEPSTEPETTTPAGFVDLVVTAAPQESQSTTPSESHEENEHIDLSATTPQEPETSTVIESTENNVDVDLSNPGTSLPKQVEEILPNIIKPLKQDLNKGKPVKLNFNIEPPPKTTTDFLQTAPKSLFPILTKYFPNNKIDLKTTAKKNSQGYITDVVLSVNIEPSNEHETTTPPQYQENNVEIIVPEQTTLNQEKETTTPTTNQEKTVDIDLSEPDSSLPKKVDELLPKIITPLKKDLNQGKPVTLNFDIEPPPKSTSDFLQTAPKSLFPILTKYFPNNKIDLKTTAKKNSQGYITDVVLSVNIEPSTEPETTTPAGFVDLVVTAAPQESQSTTPSESHEENEHIDLSATTPQEPETSTVIESTENNVDVDLSNPGTSLPKQVEEILPNIIKPLKQDLNKGKPVKLNFNIEPPPKTTTDFLQTAPKSLFPILTKYFPNNKIDLKTTAKKNSQGYITDVVLSVNIEPSNEHETTTPPQYQENNVEIIVPEQTTLNQEKETTTPTTNQEKTVDIDLSEPDSSLPKKVDELLPKIITPLKKDLNQGKPVTLNFDIEPPPKSTSDFLQTAPKSLFPILTKYFPNNKIDLKTTAKKNSQGYITDVVLSVNIEPSTEPETTTPAGFVDLVVTAAPQESQSTTPSESHEENEHIDLSATTPQEPETSTVIESTENNVDVDLSNPGTSLPKQVEEILPNIIKPLKQDLNKGKPVKLNFNIEPPPKTTTDFLQTAPKSLFPILTKYFPNNKIDLKTTAKKNSQGYITDVVLSVNIEPSNEHETTTPAQYQENNVEIIVPEQTTLNQEKETTKATTNQEKTVDIDLSEPDSSLPKKVDELLPKIITPLKKDLNQGKPVTLNFDIEPPPKSTSDFLQTAPKSLFPILTKYFPNNKIDLKTTAKKNSQGYITDVVLSVNIEPSTKPETTTPAGFVDLVVTAAPQESQSTTPSESHEENEHIDLSATTPQEPETSTVIESTENNVDVDLSNPGTSLPKQVEEILPNIIKPLKQDLNKGKPVKLNFNIEPPPKTTTDFLQTAPKSLFPILTKYFPNNKIDLKTTAKKNSQGYITDVVLSVNIEPSNEHETTTPPQYQENNVEIIVPEQTTLNQEKETTTPTTNQEKTVDIDLSEPDSSLPKKVDELLPKIITPLKKDLNQGKPVTLNFDIEPPPKSTSDFLQTAPKSLFPILTKYFPNNKIDLKSTAKKNSQGYITDVVLSVNIEPSNEHETTTPPQYQENNVEIIVPEQTTLNQEKETTTPTTNQEKTVDIDLSEPDSSLPKKVDELLPKIITPLKKDLNQGKPVTLNFDIEPPPKSTSDFLQTAPKSLFPILTKYFPNNKIDLKTTAKKNSQGYITDVVLSVNIEPSTEPETTTPAGFVDLVVTAAPQESQSTTPSESHEENEHIDLSATTPQEPETSTVIESTENNVDVDLSNPGTSLPKQVEEILPNIIKPLKQDLNKGKPVKLNFNIEPPPKTTTDFLQTAPKSLFPILTKYFPNNKIDLKTTAKKNSQGYITDVVLSVNIEPSNEHETTTPPQYQENNVEIIVPEKTTLNQEKETTTPTTNQEKTVDIDLSEPDSSLPKKVDELLPKIITPLKKDLNQGKPVTLNFDIEPPPKSTSDFLQTAPKSLFPILTKYFPNNKIDLKSTAKKNSQGYITDVVLSVNIEPSNEHEITTPPQYQENNVEIIVPEQTTLNQEKETTTPTTNQEKTVDIDLSEPDSSLPKKVDELLPKIITPLKKDLNQGKPVTLNFDIEPPPKSTGDFLQTAPKSLFPILTKYFPNNKIDLKTTAKKNIQGYITDVVLSVNIEPSTEPETTTPSGFVDLVVTAAPQESQSTTPSESHEENEHIDLSSTTPQEPETSTVIESTENNVDIDLSNPGTSLPKQVEEILPNIVKPLKQDLNKGKPVKLNFNIEPPPKTTTDFLQTAPKSLFPILTKYFPNNKIDLKTTAKKNSQGYITDVVLSVNIEPSNEHETTTPPQYQENNVEIIVPEQTTLNQEKETTTPTTNQEKTVDIDLSEPDSSLPKKVDELLPKIITPLKKDLNQGKPVTLNFDIEPPPKSTSDFLQTAPKSLFPILTKYFPNNKIDLKSTAKKNSQGYITDVVLSVNIEPSTEPETTTPAGFVDLVVTAAPQESQSTTPSESHEENETIDLAASTTPKEVEEKSKSAERDIENIDIDLTKPKSRLPDEVQNILPTIITPLKKKLAEGNPVALNFNIAPPLRSTNDFLQTAPQSLVPILSQYFPNNRISLKTTARENSQGFLTDVIISVNIEPTNEPTSTTPAISREKNVDIDLSTPGTSLPTEVDEILPSIIKPIKNDLGEGNPVTLNFNIEPPSRSTSDFLQTSLQSLVPILTKYFPYNKISLKSNAKQNSEGFLTDVVLSVNIEPSTEPGTTTPAESQEENINIDLSKPGSTLPDKVKEILPKLISPVENYLNEGNPVTLKFDIQPPPRSTNEFLQTAPQSLVPILSKYFPNNKISLKTNAEENSQGFLTDIVLSVNIEPSDQIKKSIENIHIDLTNKGFTLPEQVNELLPKVLKPVESNLKEGNPSIININIDPPLWSTTDFLKTAPQSVVPILSKYFPNNKIRLRTKAKKDNQGYLTYVVLTVIIEPNKPKPKERNVDIDLSQPGSTLPGEMNEIIPFILKPVKQDLGKKTPVTLKFTIKPPARSTANFLQTAPQSIVSILTDYFPNNKMSLKTSTQENSWGYLSNVVLSITIEPSDEKDTPNEKNIDIDLSDSETSFTNELNNMLPNVIPNVRANLKNNKPMTLKFNIQPPKGTSQDDVQSYANTLLPVLSSYFPNNQIRIKAQERKNSQGFLTFVSLIVTIDPEAAPQGENNGLRVNLDFSNQYSSMSDQVDQVMPSVTNFVQNHSQNGQPQVLYFDIKLPRWASDRYIKSVTDYLETRLSDAFPQNQITVQISNKRGYEGLGSVLEMKVTLMP